VEKLILHTNLALSENSKSKINISELKMLSLDVISDIERLTKEQPSKFSERGVWQNWKEEQEKILTTKSWYEKNIFLWFR